MMIVTGANSESFSRTLRWTYNLISWLEINTQKLYFISSYHQQDFFFVLKIQVKHSDVMQQKNVMAQQVLRLNKNLTSSQGLHSDKIVLTKQG